MAKAMVKLGVGAALAVLVAGSAGAVVQSGGPPSTPKNFSYELVIKTADRIEEMFFSG